jgi:hypothetical protein
MGRPCGQAILGRGAAHGKARGFRGRIRTARLLDARKQLCVAEVPFFVKWRQSAIAAIASATKCGREKKLLDIAAQGRTMADC